MQIVLSMMAMPEGISGATFQIAENKKDPESYVVFIDKNASTQKQRFSFGHELGHIFLGHFRSGDTLTIAPKGRTIFYHGEEIRRGDKTPLNLNKSPCEIEADAHAWAFYHKYKCAFADLKEYGQAVIKEA